MSQVRIVLSFVAGCAALWFCGCVDNGVGPAAKHAETIGNLQSMAMVAPNKLYVTQYEGSVLLSVDAATGAVTKQIDLSRFVAYVGTDSAQSTPYMSAIAASNGIAYVACERLRKVVTSSGTIPEPADSSMIVLVNVTADTVLRSVTLMKQNATALALSGGRLYVSCTGSYYDPTDGDVEYLDLTSGAVHEVVSEAAFGGAISSFVVIDSSKAYMDVMNSSYKTLVVPFNPMTGVVGDTIGGIGDAFGGLAYDGSFLYVGDRDSQHPGLVIVDPTADTIVAGPLDLGLPPSTLAAGDTVVLATTVAADYSAANMAAVTTRGRVVARDLLSIFTDNQVFVFDGNAYLIERMGRDVLTRVSGESIGVNSIVYQRKLGNL